MGRNSDSQEHIGLASGSILPGQRTPGTMLNCNNFSSYSQPIQLYPDQFMIIFNLFGNVENILLPSADTLKDPGWAAIILEYA